MIGKSGKSGVNGRGVIGCAVVVAVMCWMLSPALGQESGEKAAGETTKGKGETKSKSKSEGRTATGLQGYYAIIAGELGLSDEQKAKLTAALAKRGESLKAWDAEHGAKLSELTAQQKKAREAKDSAAAKQAGEAIKRLRESRAVIEDEGKAALTAVLTPEQRTHLAGYNLHIGAMLRFSKAELTDEQRVKAKGLALEAGKALPAEADEEQLDGAKAALWGRIEREVLTEAQREKLMKGGKTEKGVESGKSDKSEKE